MSEQEKFYRVVDGYCTFCHGHDEHKPDCMFEKKVIGVDMAKPGSDTTGKFELLSLEFFNKLIDDQIKTIDEEIKHAASKEWFDKAAKLDHQKEGLRKAKFLANSGDCHVRT